MAISDRVPVADHVALSESSFRVSARRFASSSPLLLLVMAAAVATRFLMIGEWSLWRDEETTIYFSLHTGDPFPRHFPLFFQLLRAVFELSGVSVQAARIVAATIGVMSIALVFLGVRRLIDTEVGILAAGFLTASIGHLFWSQSIRYYILVLLMQVVSVHLFLRGLELGRRRDLWAATGFLLLAALSHLSAALLIPVFIGHIGLSLVFRRRGPGYNLSTYAQALVPLALLCGFFYFQYTSFQGSMPTLIGIFGAPALPVTGARVGLLLLRFAAYFGPPAVLLALAAPFVGHTVARPTVLQFFVCLAFIPVLELVVIDFLDLAFPLWYQGFVAVVGFAVLAGITLAAFRRRGWLVLYGAALAAAIVFSVGLLYVYFTTMHGDRPRTKEAAEFLLASGVDAETPGTRVFASAPGVVAFHLGLDPSTTMKQSKVRTLPDRFTPELTETVAWLVIEQDETPPALSPWMSRACEIAATFEARSGPKDRTVRVFRCIPDTAR